MSASDVFISYARPDRAIARLFAESLIKEGFDVWWDASLHTGETFDEVIEQKLRDAKAVVVLWSPRSVASRWVRAEATLADRRNTFVPAIIEACDRPIVFELTHTADLSHWKGDRSDILWRMLVGDVSRLVRADRERAGALPEPRQEPAQGAPSASSVQSLPPHRQPLLIADERYPTQPSAGGRHAHPNVLGKVHCLEIEECELPGELIVIDAADVKIGRCPPADIVLSHKSVSREHCIVSLLDDQLFVTDLESTNGTYIDDAPISEVQILPVGSVVRLGQISLRHALLTKAEATPRERTWFQPGRIVAA